MIQMTKISLVLASLLIASQANALDITGVAADPGATLTTTWLGSGSGINVTSGTISYVGNTDIPQSGTYTGFNLLSSDPTKPNISLADGIVLTSGKATMPMTNTGGAYSNATGTGSSSWVTTASGGHPSNDANSLSFDFTVDAGVTSISSTFVYGSDEYPEWSGTAFADGFAFVVDGVNYAKFSDGTFVSLASLASNSNLNDNTGSAYGIEYDGLTNALLVTGLLNSSLTTHTLQLVIADTGDSFYDSGVFLASLNAGHAGEDGGGVTPVTPVPEPETYLMLLSGLGLLGFMTRRRKNYFW